MLLVIGFEQKQSSLRIPAVVVAVVFGLIGAACTAPDSDIATDAPTTVTGRPVLDASTTVAGDGQQADGQGDPAQAEDTDQETQNTDDGENPASDGDETVDSTTAPTDPAGDPAWFGATFELTTVAKLNAPTTLATRSGSDDLWIAERPGRVRLVRTANLELAEQPVIDISANVTTEGEGGLLGMDFSADGSLLYLSYTDTNGDSVITEYTMQGEQADPASERVVLQLDQPFTNHNGGQITFGPDGYLYVGFGDGGSGGDPQGHGQNRQTMLGSILRIDPTASGDNAYGVPTDNPYVASGDGLPEIWLWGVRNPWRFSFDSTNGDLWIGDVGQNEIEEITLLQAQGGLAGKGANLGWRITEGDNLFDGDQLPPDYSAPIFAYDHSNGRCSVTGGYVYRGQKVSALSGAYLFADYCTGEIFGLDQGADGQTVVANLSFSDEVGQVISFGEDNAGELYVLEIGGRVAKIS